MIKHSSWGLTNRSSGELFLTESLKQNPNPNSVAAAIYEDSRVVQDHLDAPLMGSNMIQGPKTERRRRSAVIDSRCQFVQKITIDS